MGGDEKTLGDTHHCVAGVAFPASSWQSSHCGFTVAAPAAPPVLPALATSSIVILSIVRPAFFKKKTKLLKKKLQTSVVIDIC